MSDHAYAVIMAGGGGTRLWPISRKERPKQLLPLNTILNDLLEADKWQDVCKKIFWVIVEDKS